MLQLVIGLETLGEIHADPLDGFPVLLESGALYSDADDEESIHRWLWRCDLISTEGDFSKSLVRKAPFVKDKEGSPIYGSTHYPVSLQICSYEHTCAATNPSKQCNCFQHCS